jgi:adenine nucleotide transporter 17
VPPSRTRLTPPSYPLITLSTRAQVESKRAQLSTLDAARRIIKREGITGLYAGLESALFGISVTNFVYYYCMSAAPAMSRHC